MIALIMHPRKVTITTLLMRKSMKTLVAAALAGAVALTASVHAADDHEVIEKVMKDLHKAPKGVDPVCKKAADGAATKEELKKLLEGYQAMAKVKPPKGEVASWKEKNGALIAAVKGLQKGAPDAAAKFKEAVNCKSCHSAHKPD